MTTITGTGGVTVYDKDGVATTSYAGCVLGCRTSYNSSMDVTSYYAIVWDREAKATREVYYGSDYPAHKRGTAVIDATDEVKAEITAHITATLEAKRAATVARWLAIPERGDSVEVTGGRKYKGATGTVFWKGEGSFGGRSDRRIGVEAPDGRIFVNEGHCTVTEPRAGRAAEAEDAYTAHVKGTIKSTLRDGGSR